MIVDVHTYLWHQREQMGEAVCGHLRRRLPEIWSQLEAGPEAHAQASEPVDVTVVLGWVSRSAGIALSNEAIAEYVAEQPERRVGFAGLDPTVRGVVARLEELPERGFTGLTISPTDQGFHPTDTRAMQLYEAAEALGLPVVVLGGTVGWPGSRLDYGRPELFDEVARTFGQLKLVLTHAGQPWVDQALAMLAKHEHVYAELGNLSMRPWRLYNVLLEAHGLGVTDRLLFGSGFPFNRPAQAIETIYSLNRLTHGTELPSIPRERLRGIVERDTLAELGIRRPTDRTGEGASTGRGVSEQSGQASDQPARAPAGGVDGGASDQEGAS